MCRSSLGENSTRSTHQNPLLARAKRFGETSLSSSCAYITSLFRRISYGATRLQEVLADRAAARLYGDQPFEEGLRHVVRRKIEFNHFAGKEIHEAVESGRALQNIYALECSQRKARLMAELGSRLVGKE